MWEEVKGMTASHYVAAAVFGVLLTALMSWLTMVSWKWPRRDLAVGFAFVTALFVGVTVAAALQIGPAQAKQEAYEAQLHRRFVQDVRPVVDELRRLGFQPPGKRDFFDEASYRFDGDVLAEGGTGRAAVRNDKGEMVWVDFQLVSSSDVLVGCLGNGLLGVGLFGAELLRATGGCLGR